MEDASTVAVGVGVEVVGTLDHEVSSTSLTEDELVQKGEAEVLL